MTPEDGYAVEISSKWEHIIATKLHDDIVAAIRDAVAAEREACAKVADSFDEHREGSQTGGVIATAIRARSDP